MSGAITIGTVYNSSNNFFSGYTDQLSLMTRAKNASEVLIDASLVCYYSFDNNSYYDFGPLGLNGTGVNIAPAFGSGRVNDAVSFALSSSYFVSGLMTKLGSTSQPYSMSIWLKPTSVSGGTIIQVSRFNYNPASWCLAFMGFSSSGQIVIQSWPNMVGIPISLIGPVLLTNVWTHVVHTYSSCNGIRLYLNGTLFSQSTPFVYVPSGYPTYIYLGSFPLTTCVAQVNNAILLGQYYGLIDEFRLFSREITAADVYSLANP